MTDPDPIPEVTAAELALGLLEGDERAAALRRMLSDRAFAADVERWRSEFGALHADWAEADPPADGLARLDAALDGAALAQSTRAVGRWRLAAAAASAVAAVLFALLVVRPASEPGGRSVATRPGLLVAAIKPVAAAEPIAVAYDPASSRLAVGPAALASANHSAELWVIPDGGKPRSVGLLSNAQATRIEIARDIAPLFRRNAQLAVTDEPLGGSRSGQPTGPIVASGLIS